MDQADLEYMRAVMERSDRRFERVVARWEQRAERMHRETTARFDALQEDMRELREESRAQTQALLRVLDRLDGGGAAPA